MIKPRVDEKVNKLVLAVGDVDVFIGIVKGLVSGDVDGQNLIDARSELSNASNAIDDAMGLIDELMAPEPTREEMES